MDLPSCPSCRQSVLDDDAEVCPFCGAPMKGGAPAPGTRASARPAAAPPRPTARPEPKSTPAPATKPATPTSTAAAPSKSAKPTSVTPASAARSTSRPAKPVKGKALSEDDLFGDDLDFDSPSSPGVSPTAPVDDGDPLEVKSAAGKDAIPASRQRTKSRP